MSGPTSQFKPTCAAPVFPKRLTEIGVLHSFFGSQPLLMVVSQEFVQKVQDFRADQVSIFTMDEVLPTFPRMSESGQSSQSVRLKPEHVTISWWKGAMVDPGKIIHVSQRDLESTSLTQGDPVHSFCSPLSLLLTQGIWRGECKSVPEVF